MQIPITDFEGLYSVSKEGKVFSIKRLKTLASALQTNGYEYVTLSDSGTRKNKLIHRLVAAAFIPNPDNLPYVNHKDGDKLNNHYLNLEWVTNRGNVSHGYKKGTTSKYTGVNWHYPLNKWRARIYYLDRLIHLGYFTDELEAAKAYNVALDEFGLTNKYRNNV